jgi:hypothetical protein
MKNKRGNILTENIIFIVLNLVFIAILMIFLFSKIETAAVLEEKYSKQIALAIDAAEPAMTIHLNMEDAIGAAEKENLPIEEIVRINKNVVTVRLREKGGYSYSFFNDVNVIPNPDAGKKEYYFVIEKND